MDGIKLEKPVLFLLIRRSLYLFTSLNMIHVFLLLYIKLIKLVKLKITNLTYQSLNYKAGGPHGTNIYK